MIRLLHELLSCATGPASNLYLETDVEMHLPSQRFPSCAKNFTFKHPQQESVNEVSIGIGFLRKTYPSVVTPAMFLS